MSYALTLSIVRREKGIRRFSTLALTDSVSSEIHAVGQAISASDPISGELFELARAGDGVEVPAKAFMDMAFDDALNMINGVQVNGSTFNMVRSAHEEIWRIVANTNDRPELFIEVA